MGRRMREVWVETGDGQVSFNFICGKQVMILNERSHSFAGVSFRGTGTNESLKAVWVYTNISRGVKEEKSWGDKKVDRREVGPHSHLKCSSQKWVSAEGRI